MPKAWRVCSTPGCATLCPPGQSRCDVCKAKAEAARGTAAQRGYGRIHARRFHGPVLRRDPMCVCRDTSHGHAAPCLAPSKHADHHPLTKRQLQAQGVDEHDPAHGRGLCAACHNKHTAHTSPGGWNAR